MKITTAAEMSAIDRATSQHHGVDSLTLMENAGGEVAILRASTGRMRIALRLSAAKGIMAAMALSRPGVCTLPEKWWKFYCWVLLKD